jgi:hypothetical protein
MKPKNRVGFMIYGTDSQEKNVFTEEKYKGLADYFVKNGTDVKSIIYNNNKAEVLRNELNDLNALLVWVNPIENGEDRTILDQLLLEIGKKGTVVSTHPDVILKIGTKKVLYETREMDWGSDVRIYQTFEEFHKNFLDSLQRSKIRVLKQFRGAGGSGVYKISLLNTDITQVSILHAKRGSMEEHRMIDDMYNQFSIFFENGNPLIDQEWNENVSNGIVRSYMSGNKVVGFGYQEINALYPSQGDPIKPGKRYYYTEKCGLFKDLKKLLEEKWLDVLSSKYGLDDNNLPIIWDTDFFINDFNAVSDEKYTLCEINVSCVSPFPESAISHIYNEVVRRTE